MIEITVSNAKTSLFRIQRSDDKFSIMQTGARWEPLILERVTYSCFEMLKMGEPVTIDVHGEFGSILVEAHMVGFTIVGNKYAVDVKFVISSVTLEVQDDYVTAYDRAMAIVKK